MNARNVLLAEANALLRKDRPPLDQQWRFSVREQTAKSVDQPGESIHLTLVAFRSYGCRYYRQGECTMCSYGTAEHIDVEPMLQLVHEAISRRQHYDTLFVSPLGSMFDASEVPVVARRGILQLAAATECSSFGCETRPEFVTEDAATEFATVLGDRGKQINFGLESSDAWILRNCLCKSSTPQEFLAGVRLLRQHGIRPVANILLGAPFLTEHESFISTLQSIKWAFQHGAHMCVLFPSNVRRWSLQHWLWQRGLYKPPSLWSLVEVLYRLGPETSQRVALSYFDRSLSDVITAIPNTCSRCREMVVSTLRRFDAQGDFGLIESLRACTCACRLGWRSRFLAAPAMPLLDRLAEAYRHIAYELFGEKWWLEKRDVVLEQLAEDSVVPRSLQDCEI